MIKAVGFDLGGVILRYGVANELAYIADKLGVSQTALMDPYEKTKRALDAGQISNQEFWTNLVKESGSKLDPETTGHLWTDEYVGDSPLIAGVLDVVDELKANGYKVGMFSNIDSEHAASNQPRHIFEHFPVVLFSYQVKVAKPDPQAYLLLAKELGVVPQEMVFVDDLETNIEGAKQAGCVGIRFLNREQLVADLEKLGIKV